MIRHFTFMLKALATTVAAQWLNYSTPGIPRLPDGKPNLAAPAPRTSDGKPELSGLWRLNPGFGYIVNIASDLKPAEVFPWAEALYRQRLDDFGKDDPHSVKCLPGAPRKIASVISGTMAKLIQTPSLITILYDDLSYRQVFLDGRELPKDPNPSFMGYSTGHWEGDTLVVQSTGFNENTWLDFGGHPHTESLRVTERFRRRDFGHIDLQVTFEDPKAYARPFTVPISVPDSS